MAATVGVGAMAATLEVATTAATPPTGLAVAHAGLAMPGLISSSCSPEILPTMSTGLPTSISNCVYFLVLFGASLLFAFLPFALAFFSSVALAEMSS